MHGLSELIVLLAVVFLGIEAFKSRSFGWGGLFCWAVAEFITGAVNLHGVLN